MKMFVFCDSNLIEICSLVSNSQVKIGSGNGLVPTMKQAIVWQCLRNYISTSAFANVIYLMADVEAKFYV